LYNGSEGEKHLRYLLDLQVFVLDKQPDDGTLVPKHVRVDS